MNNFYEVVEKVTEFLKSEAKTETVIGQQFKLGDYTCVPVMSIGMGFGGGAGEGKGGAKDKGEGEGNGVGGAAGIGIRPVGFLVSKDDHIQFISAQTSKGLNSAFEKLPDMLERYLNKRLQKEKVEVKEEEKV